MTIKSALTCLSYRLYTLHSSLTVSVLSVAGSPRSKMGRSESLLHSAIFMSRRLLLYLGDGVGTASRILLIGSFALLAVHPTLTPLFSIAPPSPAGRTSDTPRASDKRR